MNLEPPPCRFPHDDIAVVRVAVPDGCACYPDDREQDLCLQHWLDISPRGSVEVIRSYGVFICRMDGTPAATLRWDDRE